MPERNLEQLLGGYATGTLTEEERRALYEAALQDQALFNALGDEQALKELLDEPVHRRRLLEALKKNGLDTGPSWWAPVLHSLRRPRVLAIAGSLAIALLAVVFTVRLFEQVGPPQDQGMESEAPSVPAEAPGPPPSSIRPSQKQSGMRKDQPGIRARPVSPESPAKEKAKSLALRSQPQPEPKADVPRVTSPARPAEKPTGLLSPEAHLQDYGKARELFYSEAPAGKAEGSGGRVGMEEESRLGRIQAEKRAFSDEARKDKPVSEPLTGLAVDVGTVVQESPLPLGIRYSLLKREPGNRVSEVDPAGVFRSNDELRLTVEGNQDGYLYIFKQSRSGEWTILFPRLQEGPPPGIQGRTRYEVPPTGYLDLKEDGRPTRLLIAFSREPVQALHRLPSPTSKEKDRGAQLVTKVPASFIEQFLRDHPRQPLLLDKIRPSQQAPEREQAIYVGKADLSSQVLVFEQFLSHP
jgi:hypothetical protein